MIATLACLAWISASASVAAWAAIRSRGSAGRPARSSADLLLLRPSAGEEPGLARALASSAVVAERGAVRVLVADRGDAAMPAAERACRELRERGIEARVVVTGARGPNRKADQLARALAASPTPETIVVADSDVSLTGEVLDALLAELADGRCDAAWAPPVESPGRTLGDATSCAVLDSSMHCFRLLAALDPAGMVGKLVAIRRDALVRAGGFGELASFLGEDMELARRMRAAGLRVRAVATPVLSLAAGRSLRSVIARYARWIAVIRAQRPALLPAYPLLIAAAPLQLVLAGVATAVDGRAGLAAVASTVLVRALVAALARGRVRRGPPASPWSPWLADVVLLVACARALASRTLEWRGVRLRIGRRGLLAEAP